MSYKKEGNLYIPDKMRKDFMQADPAGSSKGKSGQDPLRSQTQQDEELEQEQIDNIYKHKRIAQNIVDIPAEDATREWVEFDGVSDDEQDLLINKLNQLNAQPNFQQMLKYERLTGDGFISIGAREGSAFDISNELEPGSLVDIDYLHAFSSKRMVDAMIDDDPFSETFNKFELYELEPVGDGAETRLVHSSRILHLQTRVFEGDLWGADIITPLYEPLTILDSFAWSLGQIAYAMTFKVLKSNNISMRNREEAKGVAEELEKFFNTMSLAVIGKEEELEHAGPSGSLPNLEAMADFIWDFLAGSARMPKAHILGQQQGTITGGEFDSLNYYMRISGIQENYLRPLIERLVDLLYHSSDNELPETDEPEYQLKFKPLWKLDAKTDAEIREINSKIYDKYLKHGVLTPDEVREKEFNGNSIMDEMDLELEDAKRIAQKVDNHRRAANG